MLTVEGHQHAKLSASSTEPATDTHGDVCLLVPVACCYVHRRQWRVHRGTGGPVLPDFRPRETVIQPLPPTFLTHNDTIAGFTSQSLGLPAYACKSDSSTAIKLSPRMHQNLPF